MKKKIITIIAIIVVFVLGISIGVFFNNKNSINNQQETNNQEANNQKTNNQEQNNQQETKIKEKYVVISDTSSIIYQLNDKFEKVWEYKVKNKTNVYNIVEAYKNYIYYTDNDMLYRRNINTNEVENLNIELKDYWFFSVDDNSVIYNVLFDVYHVDLSTKKQTKLDIQENNKSALINGIYYYTADNSLKTYNLSTKEKTIIDNKARILEYNSEYILFVNSNDDIYLYNGNDKEKKKVINIQYAYSSGPHYPLHIYKDTVYYIEKNEIKDLINNKVLYTYNLKDNQEITKSIRLSEDKILLDIFTNDGKPCTSDICGPSGYDSYVIVDLKNNTVTDVNENTDILEFDHEEYNIN